MNTLAFNYTFLGRHAEAVKLGEEALARSKARLGSDHPATLTRMELLAFSYSNLGRSAEALKLFEEALALMKAKLGADHPNTLQTLMNLADGYSHSAGMPRRSSSARRAWRGTRPGSGPTTSGRS